MKQWRVSWRMWSPGWDKAYGTDHAYDTEEEAREHLKGLLSMQAPHPPRPCSDHVWDIKLEKRDVGNWEVKP